MKKKGFGNSCMLFFCMAVFSLWLTIVIAFGADEKVKLQGPPPVPVQVSPVTEEAVSEQITLVGTTEAVARSRIAAEISGLVEKFPAREGDWVKKGQVLVKLRSNDVLFRLEAAQANRKKVLADIGFAEKELTRYAALKEANSIATRNYDQIWFEHKSLEQERVRTEAEIDLLKDDIKKKSVVAPFSGFVAEEHTEVGEWLPVGGPVVTLVDLSRVRITVDVPERYVVKISPGSSVRIQVDSLSEQPFQGNVSAILPEGDPNSRTFPVHVSLPNAGALVKSGMEARVSFNLGKTKKALLVPKDAVVTAGGNRLVYLLASSLAQPVPVKVTGYYDGNVAVEGPLKPGDQVVVRGNERLRPGQPVKVLK